MSSIIPFEMDFSADFQSLIDELGISTQDIVELENEIEFNGLHFPENRDHLMTPAFDSKFTAQRETDLDALTREQQGQTAMSILASVAVGEMPLNAAKTAGVTTVTVSTTAASLSTASDEAVTSKGEVGDAAQQKYVGRVSPTKLPSTDGPKRDIDVNENVPKTTSTLRHGSKNEDAEIQASVGDFPPEVPTQQAGDGRSATELIQQHEKMVRQIQELRARLAAAENRTAHSLNVVSSGWVSSTNITRNLTSTALNVAAPTHTITPIDVTNLCTSVASTKPTVLVAKPITSNLLSPFATVAGNKNPTLRTISGQNIRPAITSVSRSGSIPPTFNHQIPTTSRVMRGVQEVDEKLSRSSPEGEKSTVLAGTVPEGVEKSTEIRSEELADHNEGNLHEFLEAMRKFGTHQSRGYKQEKLAPINIEHPVWQGKWPSPKPRELTPGEAALVVELDCKTTTAPHVRRRRGIHTYKQMLEEHSRYRFAPLRPFQWKSLGAYRDWVSTFYEEHGKLVELSTKLWMFNPPVECGETHKSLITGFDTCQNTLHAFDECSMALMLHKLQRTHERCRMKKDSTFTPPETTTVTVIEDEVNDDDNEKERAKRNLESGVVPYDGATETLPTELPSFEMKKKTLREEYEACELCPFGTTSTYQSRLKVAIDKIDQTEERWIAQNSTAKTTRKEWCSLLGANGYRAVLRVKEWQRLVKSYKKGERDWELDKPQTVEDGIQMAKELREAKKALATEGSSKGSMISKKSVKDDSLHSKRPNRQKPPKRDKKAPKINTKGKQRSAGGGKIVKQVATNVIRESGTSKEMSKVSQHQLSQESSVSEANETEKVDDYHSKGEAEEATLQIENVPPEEDLNQEQEEQLLASDHSFDMTEQSGTVSPWGKQHAPNVEEFEAESDVTSSSPSTVSSGADDEADVAWVLSQGRGKRQKRTRDEEYVEDSPMMNLSCCCTLFVSIKLLTLLIASA